MRKIIAMITVVFVMAAFSACGSESKQPQQESSDQLQIVTTIFPEYDWTMNILGENPAGAEVTMLLDSGVDLHSFQPTPEDMLKIAECDLFIYVGGESDEWVEDALAGSKNENMIALNLLETLGDKAKEEEIVEGMEAEEEEAEGEEAEEEEGPELDEHVWLSLDNASDLCAAIEEALSEIDPENADAYQSNLENYQKKLSALDSDYETVTAGAPVRTLLFGDRFPFRYMTDDYGLDYYAAFAGCSAETEASFETIAFLAKKMDELGLSSIMTIENSDQKIAKAIIDNTKKKEQKILTLDSMQSVTADDVATGASYLKIMQDNLKVLKEALQ